MSLYESYAAVVAFAIGATFVLTFPVRWLAFRFGAVDHPGEHRMHSRPTPVVGGAAMFVAFCGSMALASRLTPLSGMFHPSSEEPWGVIIAAAVIYLVGLIDDVRDISAPAKVAGQVLAAMVLVFWGVTMYYFKIPFETNLITLSPEILPLITAVWVVGMANAVNLIDGLDGLAAGIVGIASAALFIYGLRLDHLGDLSSNNIGPLIAAITFGVCVGFLPHNFHPARIFMGDGGALFLGLAMAASTMVIGGRTENVAAFTDAPGLTFFRFAPLFIPFFILGVPILDTGFAIIRRTARRSNFAERDLGHLHHRLVRLGHGHRRAVLILWAWTALLSAFVLVPTFAPQANAYVPIGLAAFAVGLYTIFRPAGRAVPPSDGHMRAGDEILVEPEPDGASPDGATPNGATPNGATPNGATPNGATPNGASTVDPTSLAPTWNGQVRAGGELRVASEFDAASDKAAAVDPASFAHHDDQV